MPPDTSDLNTPAFNFRELLEDLDVKLLLDSPNGEYRFEYFTVLSKNRDTGQDVKVRKYRVLDQIRGTITPDPWDAYNLESQARILPGLISWSDYRLTVITGWKIACPACGYIMKGKPWKIPPKTCSSKASPKCNERLDHDHVLLEQHAQSRSNQAL
jgi:hypothetical protein